MSIDELKSDSSINRINILINHYLLRLQQRSFFVYSKNIHSRFPATYIDIMLGTAGGYGFALNLMAVEVANLYQPFLPFYYVY